MKKNISLFVLTAVLLILTNCHRPINAEKAQDMKLRASKYSSANDMPMALTYFDSALYYNYKYAEAYAGKSVVFMNDGDLNKAMDNINKAIKLNEEKGDFYFYKGFIYFQANKFKKAFTNFDKCIATEDGLKKQAYYYKGVMHLQQGDTIAAKICLRFSLELGYIKAAQLLNEPESNIRTKIKVNPSSSK